MTAHELARELLKCDDLEVTGSIDISTNDDDNGRRIFTDDCRGINTYKGDNNVITILFDAIPEDNYGKKI